MFVPAFNTNQRFNCYDCSEPSLDNVFRPIRRTTAPQAPKKTSFIDPFFGFDNNFDRNFDRFDRKINQSLFNSPFDMNMDFDEDLDLFGHGRKYRKATRPQTCKTERGKENVDPLWEQNMRFSKKAQKPCRESQNYSSNYSSNNSTATKDTAGKRSNNLPVPPKQKDVSDFHSTSWNSNTVIRNGKAKTVNKKTVTYNDKTEIFATKIEEDKDGNRKISSINPEIYHQEVQAILDEDEVLREIAPQNEQKMLEEQPKSENEMFLEKIKQVSENSSLNGDNRSKNSGSRDGENMLFSNIQF